MKILAEGEKADTVVCRCRKVSCKTPAGTLGSQDTAAHCGLRPELVSLATGTVTGKECEEAFSGVKGLDRDALRDDNHGGCGAWWPSRNHSAAFDESGPSTVVRTAVSRAGRLHQGRRTRPRRWRRYLSPEHSERPSANTSNWASTANTKTPLETEQRFS
jgi:hypothetical protein